MNEKATELRIEAPGKINWFLRLCGQMPDGYHRMQSLMQCIALGDSLTLRARQDGDIAFHSDKSLRISGWSLCERAAAYLRKASRCRLGADIHLESRIPNGAGLGGASSNAASVLLGLNRLWRLGLRREHLLDVAWRLSSDAPFFLGPACAWVHSDDGFIRDWPAQERALLLFVSDEGFATATRYRHPDLPRNQPRLAIDDYLGEDAPSLCRLGNAFEALSRQHDAPVRQALELAAGYGHAFMTGSGSAIVAALESQARAPAGLIEEAQASLAACPGLKGWRVIATHTLAQSPHQEPSHHG